ncbi:superoxide dismutase [Actinotalea fermentans]|uniref:Superoxide dismutase n=1 Tax=Actinotalea fermentans TaxID=43671 RepID=A0A511YU07_9CELL|nr:superoxide dismutase [Actinotalea fermentans]KGM17277.1 superoxide dismutase [Actinotalea fermentans ATCC 43279 = JCM 9966 = DSM 3133]GEN78675.1 superoxide dismutase [Actinotalea fermentans]
MAEYTLPDLPYDFGALEPHISGRIMELHHDKHHAAYVTGANQTLEKLAEARDKNDFGSVMGLEKTLAFNLGGHVNHSAFWQNLTPEGAGRPDGELAAAIDEYFGSFEAFAAQFAAVATSIQGSGWAILAWDSIGQKLITFQLYDQQGNIPLGVVPIILLDMWEHAFYLDYVNVKADYVKAWWNIVNWADAAERFARARTQTAGLIVPAL